MRTQNVVHAALFLVVVLAGAAAQYILLGAEFVAWVQVLVYIGAVIVLFLFGIMLTRAPMHPTETDGQQPAALGAPALRPARDRARRAADRRLRQRQGQARRRRRPTSPITNSIFRVYLVPFEVVGVLLLAALIGAVVLARKD